MSQEPQLSPQLLAELLEPGYYQTPQALEGLSVVVLEGEPLLRLQFRLEGGYVLDIPMTQGAKDELAQFGASLQRRRGL